MSNRFDKGGFTLVEILVAMAIIVTIVSMVYGSYFTTSKSTQVYKARIALFQQARRVLEQMARQIRCSYAGTAKKLPYPGRSIPQQGKATPTNAINYYFNSNPDDPSGEVLNLVTTNGISGWQDPTEGLFEVTYKFDKGRGLLSLSQQRFIGASKNVVKKRIWRPIARNINSIKLEFFDGHRWLKNWSFENKKKLPCAVKINITYEDENYHQYLYSTTASVCCRKSQGKETQTEILVPINK